MKKQKKKLPQGIAGAVARWGTDRKQTATIRVHADVAASFRARHGKQTVEAASRALEEYNP